MKRIAERIGPAAAVVATLLLFWTVARGGSGHVRKVPSRTASASFHGDGTIREVPPDPDCAGPKCHAASSHRASGPRSAFLNQHAEIVSCLGCHGREPERGWGVPKDGGKGGIRLVYSPSPEPGKQHAGIGPPASCTRCHSPEGRRAILSAGVKGLGEGFDSPIALRMIEGGGRKWVPDDMR